MRLYVSTMTEENQSESRKMDRHFYIIGLQKRLMLKVTKFWVWWASFNQFKFLTSSYSTPAYSFTRLLLKSIWNLEIFARFKWLWENLINQWFLCLWTHAQEQFFRFRPEIPLDKFGQKKKIVSLKYSHANWKSSDKWSLMCFKSILNIS